MIDRSAKKSVLRALLQFISRHFPLQRISIATLGGEGLEAVLWLKAGIPFEHGFLLESHQLTRRQLEALHLPYRIWCNLKTFPKRVRRGLPPNNGLDVLHLDLKGSLQRIVPSFKPLIKPLLGQGKVRCLALTVADARSNAGLRKARLVRKYLESILGEETDQLSNQLLAEQRAIKRLRPPTLPHILGPGADPAKGTQKEMGIVATLLQLLQENRVAVIPVDMERYVYLSRVTGHTWRMRSYFFWFKEFKPTKTLTWPRAFVRRWLTSPLYFVEEKKTREVRIARKKHMQKTKGDDFPLLLSLTQSLASVDRGASQREFQKLLSLANARGSATDEVQEQLKALQNGVEKAAQQLLRLGRGLEPKQVTKQPVVKKTVPSEAPLGNKLPKKLFAKVLLLKARATGDEPYAQAQEQARLLLGLPIEGHTRRLACVYAHTQGKFIPGFVYAIMHNDCLNTKEKHALLADLAQAYSVIGGKKITAAQLIRQARPPQNNLAAHNTKRKK